MFLMRELRAIKVIKKYSYNINIIIYTLLNVIFVTNNEKMYYLIFYIIL